MTVLYRFYDGDDRLLYVGIALNPLFRWEDHSQNSRKWWQVARRVTMDHFESRAEAMAAEKAAIKAEDPLHNVTHVDAKVGVTITVEPGVRYTAKKIAAEFRDAVDAGRITRWVRLPSINKMAPIFGVARATVARAIRTLRQEQLVVISYDGIFIGPRETQGT